MGETGGPGGRWLVLEAISRAIPLVEAGGVGNPIAASRSKLSSLLGSLATLELGLQEQTSSAIGDGEASVSAGCGDLVGYLELCSPYLPRSARPFSLFNEDHVTRAVSMETCDEQDCVASSGVAEQHRPLLGDVLVTLLKATVPEVHSDARDNGRREEAVRSAVTAVVMHGYGRRPLPALAAVAIAGSSSHADRKSRRLVDGGKVAAARALCVAATFVRAAADCGTAESAADTGRDLLATFPAALLAVVSKDEVIFFS